MKFTAEERADRLKQLRAGQILDRLYGYDEFVALCHGAYDALVRQQEGHDLQVTVVRRPTLLPPAAGRGEPLGLYTVYNRENDIVCGVAVRSPREVQKFRVSVGAYYASTRPIVLGRAFLAELSAESDTAIYAQLFRMCRNIYKLPDTPRIRRVVLALTEELKQRLPK